MRKVVFKLCPVWSRVATSDGCRRLVVGYARVSTKRQNLAPQIDALRHSGCDVAIVEVAKGTDNKRAGLARAIKACGRGGKLIVCRLDRLARRAVHLGPLIELISTSDICLRILSGAGAGLSLETAESRALLAIIVSVAEYEWQMVKARTKESILLPLFAIRLTGTFNSVAVL